MSFKIYQNINKHYLVRISQDEKKSYKIFPPQFSILKKVSQELPPTGSSLKCTAPRADNPQLPVHLTWKNVEAPFEEHLFELYFSKKMTFLIIDPFESLKRNSKEIYNWSYGLFLWFWLIQFRLNLASVSKLKLFWPNKHCYGTLTSPNENNLRICDIIIVT